MATETVNRYRKARKIADYLAPLVSVGLIEELPAELTPLAENTIQLQLELAEPPSKDTWALVLELIEQGR